MKIKFLLSICLLICCMMTPAFAERPVTVLSKDASGNWIETPTEDVRLKKLATGDEMSIDDFEDGDLKNDLEGESGSWNLTPDAEDISIEIEVADEAREGSQKALKITYDVEGADIAKLGFWTKLRGLDVKIYDTLSFDVRGDAQAGFTDVILVEVKKFKNEERVDKIKGTYIIPNITSEWQTIQVPLNLFTGLFDQTNPEVWKNPMIARQDLDELVINLESRRLKQKTGVLYFDNLKFTRSGKQIPTIMDQPPRKGEKTPVKLEGVEFMKFLAARLRGFPTQVLVKPELPADDRELFMMIARDTWKFFDHIVDSEHHLPLDTIQLGENTPIEEGAWVGDYTNVTNIGVYLMCLVAAQELDFITHEDAVQRIRDTMTTIERMEHHESGFLYNYYDTTTLERTSYFVSLVDSGWLDAGIYVAKNAYPELKEQAERILGKHNFSFFYDDVEQQMTHGYFAHLKVPSDYHYGSFYTEPRLTSYIAIGRGDVPMEHWFRLVRTFPEEYGWQTQMPTDREKRTTLGFTYDGGYYEWKGMKFVPSWGGSMFEALMPTLVLDEDKYAPEGLGRNNVAHVQGQIRYALEDLKYPVWGMSPSSVPEGGYSEYGAEPMGSKGYKPGVATPHATALAVEYAPEEAAKNFRELIARYPIYGEYGFYDAVTVQSGLVARKYLALDQGMILVALANYLKDGVIRDHFHRDPIHRKALPLLTEEKFFEDAQTS